MIRYVTRWALSTGIRKVDGGYTDDGKYFSSRRGNSVYGIFVSASEAFETPEDAQARAKEMAYKKRKSLLLQA